MWERAVVLTPPPKARSEIEVTDGVIPTSELAYLQRIIHSKLNKELADSSVIVYRNASLLNPNSFLSALSLSRKKIEFYGLALSDVLTNDFLTVMREHLETTTVKFRILLKNPQLGCESLSQVNWSDIKNLAKTLSVFYYFFIFIFIFFFFLFFFFFFFYLFLLFLFVSYFILIFYYNFY